MRLLAERLLADAAGTTYVDGELVSRKLKELRPPEDKHKFHVCCSDHNPGARMLVHELAEKRGFHLTLSDEGGSRRSSALASKVRRPAEVLRMTTDVTRLEECDHLLLYLNSQTWTRG